MKRAFILFLTFLVVFPGGLPVRFAGAQEKEKPAKKPFVAVLELRLGKNVDPALKEALTGQLRSSLFKTGQFEIINRADMEKIMAEWELQCVSEVECIEVGKLLSAQKIVTGDISRLGDTLSITVYLTDVETSMVERLAEEKCTKCSHDSLYGVVDRLAVQLAGRKIVVEDEAVLPRKRGVGVIEIKSDPQGAKIYLDAEYKGITPLKVSASTGRHRLVLLLEGFETISKGVDVKKDQTTKLEEILIEKTGNIEIISEPDRAVVFVDGKKVGPAPITKSGLRIGPHKVRVERKDYKAFEKSVVVEYQATTKVEAKLVPLPGILLVITNPEGADVYIDGKKQKGKTPLSDIKLPPGVYKIRVKKDGYLEDKQEVKIQPNSSEMVEFTLGTKRKKAATAATWYKKWWVWAIVGVAVVGGAVAAAGGGGGGGGGGGSGSGAPAGGIPVSW